MDSGNIATASQYVNNLLLARGLLRDGNPIDFAGPAKGGQDVVVGEVLNLVHDLILRRDRESSNISSLSQSLQSLRSSSLEQTQIIKTLEGEKAEVQRELSTVKSQLRSAKLDVKSFESKNKAYKEDIQRLRTSVGHIRAQCANDVRKRDGEIAKLKKHIDVQRTRDTRSSAGPSGVTIIDPTTGKAHYPASIIREGPRPSASGRSLADESNEHLSTLSAELSESNETLVSLIQNTTATLRTLQGLPMEINDNRPASANLQRPASAVSQVASSANEPAIHVAETPDVTALTASLTEAVASLQTLLTEPSFVPVEEVEARDAELIRLRSGWETMETRWREAISLMNGWRQRVLDGGTGTGGGSDAIIGVEDIQRGMQLAEEGLSVAGSPEQRRYRQPARGRKRDSSGSEISQASIDTYNDGEISGVMDDSVLSASPGEHATTGVAPGAPTPDDVDPTPKPKKLRFESASKLRETPKLVPAPQVLQPKNSNSRSPTRRTAEPRPVASRNLEENTPTEIQDDSVPLSSRDDLVSPDIWMQSPIKTSQNRSVHEQVSQPQPAAEGGGGGTKPVKRTVLPRRVVSKRRSSLTPAEMRGLMNGDRS